MLGKNLRKLPKIELHLHLDCCLSFDVVKKINPKIDIEAYNCLLYTSPSPRDRG